MGKFYRIVPDPGGNETWDEVEDNDGQWATREYCEQLEKERDELKRKGEELCFAYGQSLMKLDQWKLDAVEMARSIYQTGNGTITQRQVIMAKAIIDKAEGKG